MNKKLIGGLAISVATFMGLSHLLLQGDETPMVSQVETKSGSQTAVLPYAETPKFEPRIQQKKAVMTSDEIFIAEGVKQQMADIAAAYEENMRYPSYSTPLHSNNWDLMNPHPFVSQPRPLDFDESISAEIVLDRYIVYRDSELDVTVQVHGAEDDPSLNNVLVSMRSGNVDVKLGKASFVSAEAGVYVYHARISPDRMDKVALGEVQLLADIEFEKGESARVTAVAKLVGNDATLVSLGSAYVDGADLVIPAEFDVNVPGYYRIQANLYDDTGELPISHLNVAFVLNEMESEGLLKVHASALRTKGHAGPYLLKDFNITRGPARPGDKTGYGTSKSESYSVNGFDLDSYSREPYEDPMAKQRLEFLQKLAGIN